MTKPSKIGPAFILLFSVPLLGFSSVVLYNAFVKGKGFQNPIGLAGIGGAFVMGFLGLMIVYGAFVGYGRMKEQAAREEANPGSPWLWKADWAKRKAESQSKYSQIGYWMLCLFWNAICIPIAVGVVPEMARRGEPRALMPLGFCLVGFILLAVAMRASIRKQRFGNSYFEFYALPFAPGERVSGKINLKFETQAEHGIDLRLSCVRRTTTNSGENSTTNETVLWQSEKNVSSGAVGPGPLGRAIPVDFALPAESYVTDQDNPRDQVLWRLHAQADVPGVNYSDDFEVPVFRTASGTPAARTSESSSFATDNDGFAVTSRGDDESGAVQKPSHVKVVVSPQSGGTEFYFPAFRNPGRALMLFAFTAIWSGAVYFLFHSHAPWFFAAVFGFFDLLLMYAVAHSVLGSARITVGNGEIALRSGVLGMGATRRIPVSQIASILTAASMQQGNTSGNAMYAIRLRTKDGRKMTVADEIDSRQEARWIVSQIETLAGLALDTHVEADSPFGPPPQPGQAAALTAMQAMRLGKPQKFSFVSFAIFAVLVAAMFGFQFWRMSSFKARASSARKSAAATAKPLAGRIYSGHMTDADEQRIVALPAQNQAEELLERAIRHDGRALEMFESNVENWTGRLKLTEAMKGLEARSQYSKDLRVRFANADLNLTLQGFGKNEQAAEALLTRARSDKDYRAWAVYYLGMLGGRGVEYDAIHQALLGYAKHDPDARVRQWAVEGMRYLGKEEVLDELLDSFTHDPAPAVRDRAGCNIADCGNFTRQQRMRMVPKLIDLAADSRTGAQTRSLCFLSLSEITDANVPGDATAWKNWYEEHGAQKMAEFEKLDWWEVRGDE